MSHLSFDQRKIFNVIDPHAKFDQLELDFLRLTGKKHFRCPHD